MSSVNQGSEYFRSKEEVGEVLKCDFPDLGEVQIGLTGENPMKQWIAILNLREKGAGKLLG